MLDLPEPNALFDFCWFCRCGFCSAISFLILTASLPRPDSRLVFRSFRIAGDPLRLNYDNQTIGTWNCVSWSYRRTAHMLMRIGQIFAAEFGADEVPNGRVRPVLAGQSGDGPQWEGLQYLDAVHGPPSKFIHATANAPYFAMNSSSAGRDSLNCKDGWTADQVLDLLDLELHKPGPEGGNGYIASRDVKNVQAVSAVHALWYGT